MVVDFRHEAAKRGRYPGRSEARTDGYQARIATASERAAARADFGSGWYHAAALKETRVIQDHHDWI